MPDTKVATANAIDRVPFFSIQLARLTRPDLVGLIREAVDARRCVTVTYAHFHTMNLVEERAVVADTFRRIDVVGPDGVTMLWSTRILGHPLSRGNIVVMEYSLELVAPEAIRRGWSLFLFGGDAGIADRAAARLTAMYPGLRIAGTRDGIVPRTEDLQAAAALIEAAKPTIVLVGLGQPKQEEWINAFRDRLGVAAIVGVGGYLEKLARRGTIYPAWVNRTKLYWLYRLMTEPGRVWRRYTFGTLRYAVTLLQYVWRRQMGQWPAR